MAQHTQVKKRDKLVYNKNGSVDLYFVPKPPKGELKANWTETVPNTKDGLLYCVYMARYNRGLIEHGN